MKIKQTILMLCLSLLSTLLYAKNGSIVGTWKYFDEKTGKEASLVEVTEVDGVYSGTVVQFLDPKDSPDITCVNCKDDRKDKLILGMQIIRGVIKKKTNNWSGGTILATTSGKEYKVKLNLDDDGKALKVRGYIGTPLMGKTQTWERIK